MEKLFIVMPAYNEEENIKTVVEQWYHILMDKSSESRLVVADAGSTDGTHRILSELQQSQYPQLEILDTRSQYHGPKVIALYDYAVKQGADFIFQTDSDGQTDPSEFSSFWSDRNKYDGIFGNRTVRGDGKDRAFVEKVVCVLLRVFFGVKIPDANAPFRLMRTAVVKKYLYRMSPEYSLPNIMLTTFFAYYHEKTDYREISFKPRQGGKNSVNIPKIIGIGMRALRDFAAFKKEMK